MNQETIIEALQLQPHIEGGYFKRSYVSADSLDVDVGKRACMSSIYYLLTVDQPLGHWHKNTSDIMHYFHTGAALEYWLIAPDGKLTEHILSSDLSLGEPQLLVPGGYWKATFLRQGDYALLSEAVCPGFDYKDMELGASERLLGLFPQHENVIKQFAKL